MANGATKGQAAQVALQAIAGAGEGMTAKQLGALLWPDSAKTHLPAGRLIYNLRLAGWVERSVYGVATITEAGMDELVRRMGQPA